MPQVTSKDTVEKTIENFYTKLVKPKEAIKRFEFNNQIIDTNSKIKLIDFGINNDSIIYAIKADNFDTLSLFNKNNDNQNNLNKQNIENNLNNQSNQNNKDNLNNQNNFNNQNNLNIQIIQNNLNNQNNENSLNIQINQNNLNNENNLNIQNHQNNLNYENKQNNPNQNNINIQNSQNNEIYENENNGNYQNNLNNENYQNNQNNLNNLNNGNYQNQINNNNNQNLEDLTLYFVVIPENWNGKKEDSIKIDPQINFEDTLDEAINKFFMQLNKPRKAIKRFIYNHGIININSKIKLKDFVSNNESTIYAIKSDIFDSLP